MDLNCILADLDKMLRRLITEDITLETVSGEELRAVWADPSQLEQVIVNLVVNAAHAMPDGGLLKLETQNVTLDEEYARNHVEVQPGPHVLLTVSDTGHGMDTATRERIFEPFFTTKLANVGSGLGLATVHGIVAQTGGHIVVQSDAGQGTRFEVYLPAVERVPSTQTPEPQASVAPGGYETILLCEDDGAVREVIATTLQRAGYQVIKASRGAEGLAAAAHEGPLGLLVTDVIMPDMNGRTLSERLRAGHPDLRTLFISGYASNVIGHHGVLDEGVEFPQKPFTRWGLLSKVRAVLDKAAADS